MTKIYQIYLSSQAQSRRCNDGSNKSLTTASQGILNQNMFWLHVMFEVT